MAPGGAEKILTKDGWLKIKQPLNYTPPPQKSQEIAGMKP